MITTRTNSSISSFTLALFAGLGLTACGGGGGGNGGNPTTPAPQPVPELGTRIKDINTETQPVGSKNDREGTTFQGRFFFAASTPETGTELFATDATNASAALVIDIFPGADGSQPRELTVAGATLFFSAVDEAGRELWATDGTAAGTRRVLDIRAGCEGSSPRRLTAYGSSVFFAADNGATGAELWRSDGQTTSIVRDIATGAASSQPGELTAIDGWLVFDATTSRYGRELWRTDGTDSGTALIRDIRSGSGSSAIAYVTAMDGKAYFRASHVSGDSEVWMTDGNRAWRVIDLRRGLTGSSPAEFVAAGRMLYFTATTTVGRELYRTNGVLTNLVRDINRQSATASSNPACLAWMGSRLYFTANDGVHGYEPWISDGTAAGTRLLRDLAAGTASSSPCGFTGNGDYVLFAATTAATGRELWKTDGTAAGTAMVEDLNLTASAAGAAQGSTPRLFATVGGRVVGSADDGVRGRELMFATDTAMQIVPLAKERGASGGGHGITVFGTSRLFAANGGANSSGVELWQTDGSEAGTRLVRDIEPGVGSSLPAEVTVLGDSQAVFAATTTAFGRELWTTDGTEAGTRLLRDVYPGSARTRVHSSDPREFVRFGSGVVFSALSVAGRELWFTDGTAAGTRLIRDIYPGTRSSNPAELTVFGGIVLFRAYEPQTGAELWRTDGTTGGTQRVADIVPGRGNSSPEEMFVPGTGGVVYFRAGTAAAGSELWRTDGTAAGTRMVRDVYAGRTGSRPRELVERDGVVFFAADVAGGRVALVRTDGTAAGTESVVQLLDVRSLAVIGGKVSFAGRTREQGSELWMTDGTAAGTAMVVDLYAGCVGSEPGVVRTLDGSLGWFVAKTAANGRELFQVDGEGAVKLARDFWPGKASGLAAKDVGLEVAGGVLFVRADDGVTGVELWKIEVAKEEDE